MKNTYSAPEYKLILLTAQDVLTESSDFVEPDDVKDPGVNDPFDK